VVVESEITSRDPTDELLDTSDIGAAFEERTDTVLEHPFKGVAAAPTKIMLAVATSYSGRWVFVADNTEEYPMPKGACRPERSAVQKSV
jgi:hypothetical protein